MPHLRAILFDYVHTLVDSGDTGALRWYFFRLALRRLVREFPRRRQELPFLFFGVVGYVARAYSISYEKGQAQEVDLWQLFDQGFRMQGLPLDEPLVDEVVELNHRAYAERLIVPETTRRTLVQLKERGLRLGVVSNNILQLRWMTGFPLIRADDCLLDTVVLSSDVGVRKPEPRIYQEALARLGVEASRTVFVGDRVAEDVRAPKALGMPRAFLTQEFRREADPRGEADGVIRQLPELLELLPD